MLVDHEDNLSQKGDIVELYSLEDIKNYPGIRQDFIVSCENIIRDSNYNVIGFIKSKYHTEERAAFIQAYANEIGFIV